MQFDKAAFHFLSDLKANNQREWFTARKDVFKKHQDHAKEFYASIRKNLETHDEIDQFKLYRIYRDVRFSKDKTPYQPHFAGSFSRLGKQLRGSYYLRIRPGESFLAGGFWEPNKEDLYRIRKEFEIDDQEIRTIINAPLFVKYFGGKLEGEALKTAPKGFDKEHPAIDLIRQKGFIVNRKFTDEEVLAPNFLDEVDQSYKALRPFFDYMSDVLSTNLNGESIL
uniref:DUF2461 domain-containing protein n=1 Tax=Polaribacter sp. TaxID=1920175 RepID=UPI00404770AA